MSNGGRVLVKGALPEEIFIVSEDEKQHRIYSKVGPAKGMRTQRLNELATYDDDWNQVPADPERVKLFRAKLTDLEEIPYTSKKLKEFSDGY